MIKNIVLVLIFAILFVAAPIGVYLLSYSETSAIENQKVKYNLPYPGVLPDNPLYFIKATRDKILEVITRDNIKKARLYLLFSDKKAAMALNLEKKGKEKLAVQTMTKSEQYFVKLTNILKEAKKQGASPDGEFVSNIKLSNEKHREVIQNLLKRLPTGEVTSIEAALKINEQVKKEITKL